MTETVRKDVLDVLEDLSDYCPEVRFGQLIANLAVVARGASVEAIWDMEDEELLTAAQEQLEIYRSRKAEVA